MVSLLVVLLTAAACGGGDDGDEPLTNGLVPKVILSSPYFKLELRDADGLKAGGIAAKWPRPSGECPQLLGSITATTHGEAPGPGVPSFEVTAQEPALFSIHTSQWGLASEHGQTIQVWWRCRTFESIVTVVRANVGLGGERTVVDYTFSIEFPPPQPCADEENQEIIRVSEPGPGTVTLDQSARCLLKGASDDDALASCVKSAVVAETGLSDGCADCYASAAVCSHNRCAEACSEGAKACSDCLESSGCRNELFLCAGVGDPSPCLWARCVVPDPPVCVGDTAVRFAPFGVCIADLTDGHCEFPVASEIQCTPENPCVAGSCKQQPDEYAFEPDVAYVASQTPAPQDCCFDFNLDGQEDNSLATLEASWQDLVGESLLSQLDPILASGELSVLLELRGLDEVGAQSALRLNIFMGRRLAGAEDGRPGAGAFEVTSAGFDAMNGAPLVSLDATLEGSHLVAGPGADVLHLRVDAELVEVPTGTGFAITRGSLSGLVPLADVAAAMNESLASCDCFGLASDEPAISRSSSFFLCNSKIAQSHTCRAGVDEEACVRLATSGFAGCFEFGMTPDQDIDGNRDLDAVSFAYDITALPATIVGIY
ncbi:MAG: hypothetical protein H6746_07345 [Deltaproteobacteria bacterium]|nr:hypothetical protein [Deltaproteobacteria bacterium]